MKKILFFAMALTGPAIFAQATLEHTYTTLGGYNDSQKTYAFFTNSGINYYTLNGDLNQVNFYNASHVLYKTVTLPLGAGYEITKLLLPTDGFFNTNPKIEFLIVSNNYTDPTNGLTKMTLYDEDGTNLQEFGDRFIADPIKISNTSFKLITGQDESGQNLYDIYSMPGVLSVQQQEIFARPAAYPNPASDKININNPMLSGENGSIKIFSVAGAKVLEQSVNSSDKTISIDVSGLSRGTYIYKVNNYSGKFIKQ